MLWTPALHVLIFPEHFLYCVHYLIEACIKSQSGYYSYPPLTQKESKTWRRKVLVQDNSKDLNPTLELKSAAPALWDLPTWFTLTPGGWCRQELLHSSYKRPRENSSWEINLTRAILMGHLRANDRMSHQPTFKRWLKETDCESITYLHLVISAFLGGLYYIL